MGKFNQYIYIYISVNFIVGLLFSCFFYSKAFNNAHKHSYLDGVPFAINPIFLNDSQVSYTKKKIELF